MNKEKAKENIVKLTERQREVLRHFCAGSSYKEIGKALFISVPGVKSHMGNIYVKLDLAFLKPAERRKFLHQVFCPLLEEELPPGPKEDEEPQPVPKEVALAVDEDEGTLVTFEPIVINPPPPPPPPIWPRVGCFWIGALLLIGIAGTAFVLNWLGIIDIGGVLAQETPNTTLVAIIVETAVGQPSVESQSTQETPKPQATQTVPLPSTTPTPYPTGTSVPLPFTDNFNNGAKPEWDVVVGNWRMVDGAYTADDINDWNVSLVGSEAWKDIVINVDAITNNWNYPMRVIVRAYQGKYLVMETDCCGIRFILNVDGEERIIAESDARGLTGSIDWHTNHIRIEATNGIYMLFIDGVKLLTVQDNTFESGRVGLSLDYENSRFDNFSVQQLSN